MARNALQKINEVMLLQRKLTSNVALPDVGFWGRMRCKTPIEAIVEP